MWIYFSINQSFWLSHQLLRFHAFPSKMNLLPRNQIQIIIFFHLSYGVSSLIFLLIMKLETELFNWCQKWKCYSIALKKYQFCSFLFCLSFLHLCVPFFLYNVRLLVLLNVFCPSRSHPCQIIHEIFFLIIVGTG